LETIQRTSTIVRQYAKKINNSDAVLIFANNSFILTLVPLLFFLARRQGKPFYLKPIGGDFDLYLTTQRRWLRQYILKVLSSVEGIFAQTRQLQVALVEWGCTNTYHIPGCRPFLPGSMSRKVNAEKAQLIFLSQIKSEKGVFVLLEALRRLAQESPVEVSCDFYGPIFEESEATFFEALERTPRTRYCGVVEAGMAPYLMAQYTALVLPTHFVSEGHPGAIIEAMQVGVPVISTQHRAIPELITHGQNGFLVPPQNSDELAEAIKQLILSPSLQERISAANRVKAQMFQADVVIPKILEHMFQDHFFVNTKHKDSDAR
jgi:glycosyltransferase involved in cell wall biosynthesis